MKSLLAIIAIIWLIGGGLLGHGLTPQGVFGMIGEKIAGEKVEQAMETIRDLPVIGGVAQFIGNGVQALKNKATEPYPGETRDGITYAGKFSNTPLVICNKFGVFGSQWCGLAVPSTQ